MKELFSMGNASHNNLGITEQKNKYEVLNYEFDINNQNDSHALIANRVKKNAKVLDVGCATGIIGQLLKKFKSCHIDGIELDEEAIKVAKTTNAYDNFYSFSIINKDDSEYQKFMKNNTKYDYIIFADVLEHLVEPWEVIYSFSKKLTKNGKILVSIPNINHIDIIKALINNEFNYNNIGIMDNTHLRFFTANSFLEMMENYNKRYNKYFSVNYYGKTTCNPSYYINEKLFKEENYNIVQNLFELSLVDSKEKIKYINRPKQNDNFNRIQKEYNELNNNYKKINEDFQELSKSNKMLELELENTKQVLNQVLNSKRYKLISKIASIKNIKK